jgi:hypothetical protein
MKKLNDNNKERRSNTRKVIHILFLPKIIIKSTSISQKLWKQL